MLQYLIISKEWITMYNQLNNDHNLTMQNKPTFNLLKILLIMLIIILGQVLVISPVLVMADDQMTFQSKTTELHHPSQEDKTTQENVKCTPDQLGTELHTSTQTTQEKSLDQEKLTTSELENQTTEEEVNIDSKIKLPHLNENRTDQMMRQVDSSLFPRVPLPDEEEPEVTFDDTLAKEDIIIDTKTINTQEDENIHLGMLAYEHIWYISEEIGARMTGTEQEQLIQKYIQDQLESYGYEVQKADFEFDGQDGKSYSSQNISVLKPGNMEREIIVGAHYDSMALDGSQGSDDNASGIGLVLELAHRLYEIPTNYSIRFVFFGAEELNLNGSKAYVEAMSVQERENTIGMINIDSILVGDKTYIHAGLGGDHWLQNQAFDVATALGVQGMVVNPGVNPEYPHGETGNWSDHAAFNNIGIPVIYLEATNWLAGDKDGYSQTDKFGPIFDTEKDNLAFINKEFPGRAQDHLNVYANLAYHLLMNVTEPG